MENKIKQNKWKWHIIIENLAYFLALLMLLVILCVSLFYIEKTSTPNDYRNKCREAGGVPINNRGYINCAKDGYIDIQ